MMQQHIDRSRQTRRGMTASAALHLALLVPLALTVGGTAVRQAAGDELTEIAYIEARYGEDVAAKVKLKETPRRRPEPPGRGGATDSAFKPAEPASPAPPRPEPQPLTARPDLPRVEPTQRPQVAVAEAAVPAAQPMAEPRTLAAAPQLEAKVPRPANRQVIDASRLQGTLVDRAPDDVTAPARAVARPAGQFKPQAGGLQSRTGQAATGGEIAAVAGSERRSGGVSEAPAATAAGGSLQSNSRAAYQAPASSLAPAGKGGGREGGQGVADVSGPSGTGGAGQSGRKTILNYGSGSGGRGGSLAGRSRLAEPEPAADIVAKPAAEPAPKQAVAEVELEGNGVGMTLSGQIQGRKILTSVAPEYTAKARKNGWEGVVAVHFTVLADGRVKDNTYFEQTSVHRDLNQMALTAIKQFRFAPLPNDQAAVEQWGVITIVFRLN
jgi:protein TonB